MWALNNQTAYAASCNWTRDKKGAHQWVVAVKATFDIAVAGALTLADEQPPPLLAPEYHGKPGASSLRFDSDLLALKPCTDVVAAACAYSPSGYASGSLAVSMRVGSIHKQLVVHGERTYSKAGTRALATTAPKPFVKRAILYEHAFGGIDQLDPDPARHGYDARNPVGCGFALKDDRLLHTPAPSIEYARGDLKTNGPAGLGPIDASWSPRRERAGTFDVAWERSRRPLLPEDYDELYASSAPPDQRPAEFLRGGERVELNNLTPEGLLRFDLPKIYLVFHTRVSGRTEEHRARLTAVLLTPETKQVALVWQTSLRVAMHDEEYLDFTTIDEKPYVG